MKQRRNGMVIRKAFCSFIKNFMVEDKVWKKTGNRDHTRISKGTAGNRQ